MINLGNFVVSEFFYIFAIIKIMETLISLVIWVLLALWCKKIAEKNHRDEGIAVLLGILFGIFAVIGYYIAGEKTPTIGPKA